MKAILLQCKFLLVEFLNVSYLLIPNPLRNWYLRLFGIRIGGGKSCIHRGCKFFHVGKMSVGQNTVINFGCYLDNRRGIYIGNNVGIAHNTKIYTLGHDLNDPKFSTKGASVHIGDDVFIFSNALVITKDVEPWSIVGGNPAKKIRERNRDIDYKQVYRYWFAL